MIGLAANVEEAEVGEEIAGKEEIKRRESQ